MLSLGMKENLHFQAIHYILMVYMCANYIVFGTFPKVINKSPLIVSVMATISYTLLFPSLIVALWGVIILFF